jgi:hypothetical protein
MYYGNAANNLFARSKVVVTVRLSLEKAAS